MTEKDFVAKVYIALKESEETMYWLDLLHQAEFIDKKIYTSLYNDCQELAKILTKTIKTIQSKS